MECICLELHFPRSKPCLFSFIYRPPSSNVSYFDLLDSLLNKIDSEGSQSIILGDFNFDLLSQIPVNSRFVDLFHGFNYTQLITVATRPISGTLLDHIIFTNDCRIQMYNFLFCFFFIVCSRGLRIFCVPCLVTRIVSS